MRETTTTKEGHLEQQLQRVAEAIKEYGRPTWIAYTSKADRDAIPTQVLVALLEQAHRDPATMKRADKYEAILEFAKVSLFEEVTAKQMGDLAEMSPATARKFLEDRPDLFKPIRRGVWEVRDATADRQADRR
jgi:hypothetical protein